MPQRYTVVAPFYDVLSAEWPVYRVGRLRGIPQLRLRPGQRVIDIGCGTGLNLPALRHAVGDSGHVTGIDRSHEMLRVARRRVGAGIPNVELVAHDATRLDELAEARRSALPGADAILFTYSLSLMRPWAEAWRGALALARPGARIVLVDMAQPTGAVALFRPLARIACRLGGSDIEAHPWTALEADCVDVSQETARGGHIQIWSGTWTGKSPDTVPSTAERTQRSQP